MTVWVFGASYAEQHEGLRDQWMQKVADGLETNVISFGKPGSSLDYLYQTFNDHRNQIKEGDVVIVTLTSHVKRWFFKYYPEHTIVPDVTDKSSYNFKMISPRGLEKESEALELYQEHLNNHEVYEVYSINFLYNLQYLATKKNIHTIVLVSYYDTDKWIEDKKYLFPFLNIAWNKLLEISLNEFSKEFLVSYDFSKTDIRVNHLTRSNHIILANKILDNIKNKSPIDLGTGFVKNHIEEDFDDNPIFIRNELFGGIAYKGKR